MREFFEKLEYMIKADDPRIKPYLNPTRTLTRKHPAEHLPPAVIDAYETLYYTTFGTNAAYIGDVNKIHESGKAFRGRTSSSQVETRGGAISKGAPHEKKIPIRNEAAFHLKAKMDKKLRKLAREIYKALEDPSHIAPPVRCPGCGVIQDDTWNFCGRCGTSLKEKK